MQATATAHAGAALGFYAPETSAPAFTAEELLRVIPRIRETAFVVREGSGGRVGVGVGGRTMAAPAGRVSASAFMALTPAVVRYACTGLRQDGQGQLQRRHHVFAKVSRPEVARQFLAPAPADILQALVARGRLTRAEATLASRVAVAED